MNFIVDTRKEKSNWFLCEQKEGFNKNTKIMSPLYGGPAEIFG
jgi:hypothetical protein